MSGLEKDQLIRQISKGGLGADIETFLIDRQAGGLSARTIEFYHCELGLWRQWLAGQGIDRVQAVTSDRVRRWMLALDETRNPGGLHANYRALKTFLLWIWAEYDMQEPNCV